MIDYEGIREEIILENVEQEGNVYHAENVFSANAYLKAAKNLELPREAKAKMIEYIPQILEGQVEIVWQDGEPALKESK